jgi:LAO/AO transport system kinase
MEVRQRTAMLDAYEKGVRAGKRAMLARAITLIESAKPEHTALSEELLERLRDTTGRAHRIGISGVPGVGKSTAIDCLGAKLLERGHRVAVLAVDPTSSLSGGSILGDKTRMPRLSRSPAAFIRPSPTSGTLGGVARRTREALALVEAAGFDVVIVETVGVGQSELAVAAMVDFFLVLLLAGGGDELQGIKRGILELADMLAVTKADGDNVERAQRAASIYQGALAVLAPPTPHWIPPVVMISARTGRGLDELWDHVEEHKRRAIASGEWHRRRGEQAVAWMREALRERLLARLLGGAGLEARIRELERQVRVGARTPVRAVREILTAIDAPAGT